MRKDHIVLEVRNNTDFTKKQVLTMFNALIRAFNKAMLAGERVEIRDWGVFSVKFWASRPARNLKTGEAMIIPPTKKIVFKSCYKMKELLNARDDSKNS